MKYVAGALCFLVMFAVVLWVMIDIITKPTPETIVKSYLMNQIRLDDSNESHLKVSQCARMNNDALVGYICAVTITADGTSNTVILPFKQSELEGKAKPLEEKQPQFDHRKDVDI